MSGSGGRPDLALGDSGEPVSELQYRLQTLGLYLGNLDGELGERTAAALHEFALVYHVTVDSLSDARIVDDALWEAILLHSGGAAGAPGAAVDGAGQGAGHPADGELSENQAWVWHDGTWHPAEPAAGPSTDDQEHISEDGFWRWVDNQWQPNR